MNARIMKVHFYRQRPTGREEIGALVLRDGILVAEPPDSIALNNVLDEPVHHDDGAGKVTILDAKLHPEEFLRGAADHLSRDLLLGGEG